MTRSPILLSEISPKPLHVKISGAGRTPAPPNEIRGGQETREACKGTLLCLPSPLTQELHVTVPFFPPSLSLKRKWRRGLEEKPALASGDLRRFSTAWGTPERSRWRKLGENCSQDKLPIWAAFDPSRATDLLGMAVGGGLDSRFLLCVKIPQRCLGGGLAPVAGTRCTDVLGPPPRECRDPPGHGPGSSRAGSRWLLSAARP